MSVTTRPARREDAGDLRGILNGIVAAGGTTAHQTPFTTERVLSQYIVRDRGLVCTVVEVDGKCAGFQSLAWPDEDGQAFPDGWAIIATFVSPAAAGRGAGRALFAATTDAARAAGVRVIDATIRADNSGGLAFYERMGFVDYDVLPAVPLRDGTRVDRVRKRFDLA